MKQSLTTAGALLLAVAAVLPVSHRAFGQATQGWTSLIDGKSLDHWKEIGEANWKIEDGAAVATKGTGYLVSKQLYGDFQLKAGVLGR